jgi:hypothetical protein
MCYLKLEMHDNCVIDCTEALQADPGKGKALYRRALAYDALDKLGDAFKVLPSFLHWYLSLIPFPDILP